MGNIGCIKSYGRVQNDPENILRLKNKLDLSQFLATVDLLDQKETRQAEDAIDTELQLFKPAGKTSLR